MRPRYTKTLMLCMGILLGFSLITTSILGAYAEEKYRFAVVYPIVHPFFGETTRGAEEAAEERGRKRSGKFSCLYNFDAEAAKGEFPS